MKFYNLENNEIGENLGDNIADIIEFEDGVCVLKFEDRGQVLTFSDINKVKQYLKRCRFNSAVLVSSETSELI